MAIDTPLVINAIPATRYALDRCWRAPGIIVSFDIISTDGYKLTSLLVGSAYSYGYEYIAKQVSTGDLHPCRRDCRN